MKKESVFESDTPTMEMETQTFRQMQQGQPMPVVGGIGINPYTGLAFNPAAAPYPLQHVYGNFNRFAAPPMTPQYVVNPGTYHLQPTFGFGSGNMQPTPTGGPTTGYWGGSANPSFYGSGFPTPYMTTPNQETWGTTPGTPMTGHPSGVPFTQPGFGTYRPQQASAYYHPAINVADGQFMLVPSQYPQGTASKNGSSFSKNGERDFISWTPNVNILETDTSFKIEVCVPGVTKENCHLNVDKNNILHVTGTRRWSQETDAVGFTRKEFNYGTFNCKFLLTENLQKSKITSSCRSGLLIISIPKKEGSDGEDKSSSDISIS